MARYAIDASFTVSETDDRGITWSTPRQLPTFWVEAHSERFAERMAVEIVSTLAAAIAGEDARRVAVNVAAVEL